MNLHKTATNCKVCDRVLPVEYTVTCKKCSHYVCHNCYSVQDQSEKSRGWILCDNCNNTIH